MTIFIFDVLSFLVFAPAVVALLLLFVPSEQKAIARIVALVGSAVIGGVAAAVFFAYNTAVPGYQMVLQTEWFELLGASWHVSAATRSFTWNAHSISRKPALIMRSGWTWTCPIQTSC